MGRGKLVVMPPSVSQAQLAAELAAQAQTPLPIRVIRDVNKVREQITGLLKEARDAIDQLRSDDVAERRVLEAYRSRLVEASAEVDRYHATALATCASLIEGMVERNVAMVRESMKELAEAAVEKSEAETQT